MDGLLKDSGYLGGNFGEAIDSKFGESKQGMLRYKEHELHFTALLYFGLSTRRGGC